MVHAKAGTLEEMLPERECHIRFSHLEVSTTRCRADGGALGMRSSALLLCWCVKGRAPCMACPDMALGFVVRCDISILGHGASCGREGASLHCHSPEEEEQDRYICPVK